MKLLLWAMVGGALGSCARHAVNVGFGRWLGAGGFPWWTLSVNIAGCLLMGALIEALALRFSGSQELRTFFATGVLGGFTTFSAFSLDFATLAGRSAHLQAGAYLVASVAASIAAFYFGLWLMRALLT
jgi:CrcB protein